MAFATHQGPWEGTNRLWFEDPRKPEESVGTMRLEGDTLHVGWSFRGVAQTGMLNLTVAAESAAIDWMDTWHAAGGMRSTGTATDTTLVVSTTYPGGEGAPDWGWRTEIDASDPQELVLRMINIDPAGTETLAVELVGRRIEVGDVDVDSTATTL